MVEVSLKFTKTTSRLAGNPYGRQVYDEQVKAYFNPKGRMKIIFPDNIQDVASSFVQGFFKEIIQEIGKKAVFEQIEIQGAERVKRRIVDNV